MVPLLVTVAAALVAGVAAAAAVASLDRGHTKVVDQDTAPSRRRLVVTAALLGGLAVLSILLGGLAEAVEQRTVVVSWDEAVEHWAATESGTVSTTLLQLVTHLGDTVTIVATAAIITAVLLVKGHLRLALFLVTVVVGQWLLSNGTKELVQRTRPQLDPLTSFNGFSFPSGHSTAAASTFLAIAIVVMAIRPTWRRPVIVGIAVGAAVAVGASRALLGVHWFSDVVGGLALGWVWCLLCAFAYDVLRRRPASPSATSTTTSSPSVT
jgi:undecaprenyl-diphosphatase